MLDFHKGNTVLQRKQYMGIMKLNMLLSLVIIYGFVADEYMDDISDRICHIYRLYLR